jgi:hypothetical protein
MLPAGESLGVGVEVGVTTGFKGNLDLGLVEDCPGLGQISVTTSVYEEE